MEENEEYWTMEELQGMELEMLRRIASEEAGMKDAFTMSRSRLIRLLAYEAASAAEPKPEPPCVDTKQVPEAERAKLAEFVVVMLQAIKEGLLDEHIRTIAVACVERKKEIGR